MKPKQTKIDRSAAKWLPGAMALAATTASSQAATVQITLTGNKISSTGGNQLVADLTGDTVPDMVINATYQGGPDWYQVGTDNVSAAVGNTNVWLTAGGSSSSWSVDASFAPGGVGVASATEMADKQSISYLNPVTFTDSRINGGNPTDGWLQVNAFNTSETSHTVEFSRLIFDASSTTRPGFASIPGAQTEWGAVPEPSSLGLLALGAGGLLLRRRRAAA
jgi:hypothetical protein